MCTIPIMEDNTANDVVSAARSNQSENLAEEKPLVTIKVEQNCQ